MLEGKDYRSVDMLFPFVTGFIDQATGCTKEAPLTRVHSSCCMLVRKLMGRYGLCRSEKREIEGLHMEEEEFRGLVVNIFKDQFGFRLYTLKFHLLVYIVEDLKQLGSLKRLDSSPF